MHFFLHTAMSLSMQSNFHFEPAFHSPYLMCVLTDGELLCCMEGKLFWDSPNNVNTVM